VEVIHTAANFSVANLKELKVLTAECRSRCRFHKLIELASIRSASSTRREMCLTIKHPDSVTVARIPG